MKEKLTKRLIDSRKPEEGKRIKLYDSDVTGFGVIVYPSGRKSFFVEYGPERRRQRMALGQYGVLTVEQARDMAKVQLGQIVQGANPIQEREAQRKIPTVTEWIDEYLKEVERRKKQPRHDKRYLGMAKDKWGSRLITEVTRREVQVEMERIAEKGHPTANRWLASVRACFHAACKAGVLSDDPAWGIRPYREAPPRARVLSDDEFARVVDVINFLPDVYGRAAFLLLLDTGARKSEVLSAKWEDIDLDAALWRIPSPKAGFPQVVPLMPSTVQLLKELPRLGSWVIPGRDPKDHRSDLKRAWELVRQDAKLEGVTIHDMRRTFGLHVARRAGLHIASKLLRHSDIRVTERVYVPLGLDDMRDALAKTHEERGKVIRLRQQEG